MSGQSLTIDNTWLHAADGSLSQPDSALIYTITALPQSGVLTVDGTTLALNGQFTQQQIDDGLLVYTGDPSTLDDSFGFSISDAPSGNLASGTFNVVYSGSAISDFFSGETVTGGINAVTFFSGQGSNSFTGGTDTTVSYALAPAGVSISLPSGATNGYGGNDTFTNIHDVIGSSHNDTIFSGGTNLIFGGGGDDRILGQGNETAGFTGARSDYVVLAVNADEAKIIDVRPGSPDGTVDAPGVHSFQFSDGTYSLAQLGALNQLDTSGSTILGYIGDNYFLYTSGTASEPELKYQGNPISVSGFGALFAIGAEQVAGGGYDVAWESLSNPGPGGTVTYTVWSVDSNGNYVSTLLGPVPASNQALEALETSTFSQDLNNDGIIGIPNVTAIETFGSTELGQASNFYFLNPVAGGTGPELKYAGARFVASAWTPIGAEQTSTGYEVALFNASSHLYTIWNTDSSGNVVSASLAGVSGTNTALESIEVSFHQDLNGDGTIGIPGVIETFGATELMQVGNNYFFNPVTGGSGLELMYGGAPWAAGQTWAPIGVEKTSSGYEVALLNASTHLYTIWNTDSSGNVLGASLGNASGTSAALESIETSFQQDLNGDGTIGIPVATGTTIEAFGVTKLVQSNNDFFFNPIAGGSGPELTYGGAPWAAGQAWAPIGVEKTSSGYEVALLNASSHLYTIWNTDSSGNVLGASLGNASGTSTALESIETSFQQDLNGDGTIGIPGTTIEAFGVTKLVQSNNDFFFNPVAGGTGPELMYSGTPWAAGQAWAPIGVEKTSSGYEVALLNASSHLYTIWNTDSSGNVLGASLGNASGTSTALESIETSFQQDLNGDNTIGIPVATGTTIEAFGVTKLVQSNNDFFFNPVAGGSGPELMYSGTPWAPGQAWAPIGVEKTSTGYEVALFNASSQLYTVWNTDSGGNVLSASIAGVSGTNTALESIETSFQQDLNGDHVIGPPSHTAVATAAAAPITAPSSGNAILSGSAAADTFVFNAHFGNDTVAGFQPGVDQINIDHTLFASISDLFTHTADNAGGSAVITVAADQSITIDGISKALLLQHASGFHLT